MTLSSWNGGDNDGTLWCERPAYVQELFLKERLAARPELVQKGLVQAVLDVTASVEDWFAESRHPRFGTPFGQLTYQPMLELLELVRANGFHVFVVTGGGVERRDGQAVLVRQAKMLGSPNEGPPKAVNIQTHIGRRPILAVGNSAGDREMLEYVHFGWTVVSMRRDWSQVFA